MARRHHAIDTSSLEMLLDTMCNTFGCVIFIAVLLAVLMQQVGTVADSAQRTGVTALEAQRQQARADQLRAEIEALRTTLQALRKATAVKGPALPDLTGPVRDAEQEASETRASLEQARTAVTAAAGTVDALRREAERLAGAIRELDDRLAGAPPSVPREFRVPQLQAATPDAVFNCVLHGGRFYALRPPGKGFDTEDAQVSEVANGGFAVTVRPGAGQPIGDDPKAVGGKLGDALALDPTGILMEFTVYPDSFGEFIVVKQWFVDRGFSYNWRPQPAGQPLLYGPAAGLEQQ
jgi:hypothetical protein